MVVYNRYCNLHPRFIPWYYIWPTTYESSKCDPYSGHACDIVWVYMVSIYHLITKEVEYCHLCLNKECNEWGGWNCWYINIWLSMTCFFFALMITMFLSLLDIRDGKIKQKNCIINGRNRIYGGHNDYTG